MIATLLPTSAILAVLAFLNLLAAVVFVGMAGVRDTAQQQVLAERINLASNLAIVAIAILVVFFGAWIAAIVRQRTGGGGGADPH